MNAVFLNQLFEMTKFGNDSIKKFEMSFFELTLKGCLTVIMLILKKKSFVEKGNEIGVKDKFNRFGFSKIVEIGA